MFGKILLICLIAFACPVNAQDTLHLDFGNTQVVPDEKMEAKIVAWGKTLNGKKQDINVFAYFHKGEFKQFAQQRLDEMYLSINRKVRDLVNIKLQEVKKGENYQRTRVDIIYWPEGSNPKAGGKKKDDVAKEDKKDKKEDKKDDKKDSKTAKTDDKKSNDKKADDKKSDDSKSDDKKAGNDGQVGKDAGKKKGDEGKTIKYNPEKEYLDSTYVNGVLKVTKRKKK